MLGGGVLLFSPVIVVALFFWVLVGSLRTARFSHCGTQCEDEFPPVDNSNLKHCGEWRFFADLPMRLIAAMF